MEIRSSVSNVNMNVGINIVESFANSSATKSSGNGKNQMLPKGLRNASVDITGMSLNDFKKVKIPSDLKEQVLSMAQEEFLNNYGMGYTDEFRALQKEYAASLPLSEQIDAIWTIEQMFGMEGSRLTNLVKSAIPGWESGQEFDRNLVIDLIANNKTIDINA